MPKLKRHTNPFRDCVVVTAKETFIGEHVTIRAGEKRRGNDEVVERHWGVFAEGDLLPHELAKIAADEIPLDPPVHRDERFRIGQGVTPPPHRQVIAIADTFTPIPFAPGSPGARGGVPPAPFGAGIRRGRVYDIADPAVRANPQLFEFPRRDVTLADVERLTVEDAGQPAA